MASDRPLRLSGVVQESSVDGPGIRYVVFVQGCPHGCPGCHNPPTHHFEGGYEADLDEIVAQVREDPLLQGVTFSGGEPCGQPEALCTLAHRLRPYIKDLVVYSGYPLEQLEEMAGQRPAVGELLALCDVLIDGPYIAAQRALTLQYRGSAHQRVIQLHQRNP